MCSHDNRSVYYIVGGCIYVFQQIPTSGQDLGLTRQIAVEVVVLDLQQDTCLDLTASVHLDLVLVNRCLEWSKHNLMMLCLQVQCIHVDVQCTCTCKYSVHVHENIKEPQLPRL